MMHTEGLMGGAVKLCCIFSGIWFGEPVYRAINNLLSLKQWRRDTKVGLCALPFLCGCPSKLGNKA